MSVKSGQSMVLQNENANHRKLLICRSSALADQLFFIIYLVEIPAFNLEKCSVVCPEKTEMQFARLPAAIISPSQKVTHCVTNLHLTKSWCIVRIPVDERQLEHLAEYADTDPSRVLTLEGILHSPS